MLPPGESHWVCTKGQTDGRQTIALCISLHTASVVMPVKQKLKIVVCKCISSRVVSFSKAKLRGKGFSYLLPSVGPGADPAVQAVSPQVTISHPPGGRRPLLFARHVLPFQPQSITTFWPVQVILVGEWQRHICVNNLPKVVTQLLPGVGFEPMTCWSQVQRSTHCAT